MKTAALFAIASGATAPDSAAPSVSQSLPPPEVHAGALLKGYLRPGLDNTTFARRLDTYPEGYDSRGCLGDHFSRTSARIACVSKVAKEIKYRRSTVTSARTPTAKIIACLKVN